MRYTYRKRPKLDKEKADLLKKKAEELILPRVEYYSKVTNLYPKEVKFKAVRSYWGQCRGTGVVTFSILLALTPETIIDSVVIHELCHLKEMNHQKPFWNLVYQYMPKGTYNVTKKFLKNNSKELKEQLWDFS